jgi:hypothetical protein
MLQTNQPALEQTDEITLEQQQFVDEWDKYLQSQQHLNKYDDYAIAHNWMQQWVDANKKVA